ncbi:MAG TPA: PAS domain S-box protein [Polyangiaceae bacterium]|nr:PAS domain S-box protein [Polyangiaceae bacterium]
MLDFEAILGRLEVAVLVHDAAGHILYANRAASRMLGVDAAELLRRSSFDPVWDCLDEQGRKLAPEELPNVVATRTKLPVRELVLGVLRGSDRVWIEVWAEPSYLENGDVDHVVVTFTDISHERQARREAERAREATENLHQSVLRAMSEGVVVHGADGSIDFANPAAERALGLSLEQMMGRSPVDSRWRLLDERDEPLAPEKIPSEITRATGAGCDQVAIGVHRASGERAWLSVSTDPVAIDPDTGKPSAVVATFTDVTRETLIKRELERSRAQLKLVMDAFPGVLYEFRGREGKYRFGFLSGRADEFFGPLTQIALSDATPVIAALHPEEQQSFIASVRESERNLTPWHFEGRLPLPDGSWRWARAQSVPMREGDEVVWHGVLIDVTEQRRIAETLRHRQKVEAMGELVAGVAHNFNNMLAVIMPNLDMAIDDVSGETRVILSEARHATHSAAELVRQLMRITRREPDAAPELVDMVAMLRDVGALLKRTLGSTMSLKISSPRGPLVVRGVPSDLNVVLLNLCFNARDALSSVTGAELSIRLTTREAERELVLEVEDNGSGMSEATLQRLGEPFFTTKGPGAGTGLGVATVYGLVRALAGCVEVESQLGKGTLFRVVLPLETISQPTARDEINTAKRLEGIRVLVIEDEAYVREALVRQLLSVGAEVEAAGDGDSGLAAFQSRGFDAVLLDLNLPGLSGSAVLEGIRKLDHEQAVVVLTGHVNQSDALERASSVLTKPVTRAALVDAITRSVHVGRAAAPPAPASLQRSNPPS